MENKRKTISKSLWYSKWKNFYQEGIEEIDKEIISESKDTEQKINKKIDKDFQTFEKFIKLELKKLKTKIKNNT